MRFTNPWADQDNFLSLGTYTIQDVSGKRDYYEIYALTALDSKTVHFGARYSNEPEAYLSGSASLSGKEWMIYTHASPLLMAVARYFANHHE